MSMARLVVTAVVVEGRSKSEVARAYGVSRRWVHELVRRWEADGEAGLAPRSKRPHHSPGRISQELEDAIVALRKDLAGQGLDAGAATIAALLAREHGTSPAVSTIWRVLSRRGFITPEPHKRPRSSYTRFEADQPNQRWQADTTHWRLADGTGVEILNIIDDHSRLAVASTVRPTFKAADVVEAFTDAFQRHGVPATVLTDNAAIFTGAPRGHGKVAFEAHLEALGVRLIHSRAYHPQTCGKSNDSTRPSNGGWPCTPPTPSPACRHTSTSSPATTTPTGPTAPCTGAPPTKPGTPARQPAPGPSPPPTTGSDATPSTTGPSPCATTAACTTSASGNATAAPPSSCSSPTFTSASSTPPRANSSATWSSTPPATTNPAASNPGHNPPPHATMSRDRCEPCLGTSHCAPDLPACEPRHFGRSGSGGGAGACQSPTRGVLAVRSG